MARGSYLVERTGGDTMADDRSGARPLDAGDEPVTPPGILLGLGMGGFVDGIVLHQILQWHQLLSETDDYGDATLADMEVNVTADGLFHAVTWIFVAIGLAMLWRVTRDGTWRRTWRSLLGWMLVGWGVFNLVEGTINHHLLGIHRVRPDAADPLWWDIGFLVIGALLVGGGWLLQRSDPRRTDRSGHWDRSVSRR